MTSDGSTATYFCINYSAEMIVRLQNILRAHSHHSHRLFLLDTLTVHELLKEWSAIMNEQRILLLDFVSHKYVTAGAEEKFLFR